MSGCHPTEIQKCEMHSIAYENYFGDWICPKCHLERSSEVGELEKPVSPMVEQMQRLEERIKELEDWTRTDEEVIYARIKELTDHKNYQTDENRKISRHVDELEKSFKVVLQFQENKKPHKCPVCNGKCSTTLKELTCGTPFIVMPCSSCEGKGIVWG